MALGPLADHIVTSLEAMPTQLQMAARSALNRLHDAARLSTRYQARRAGIQATTITRPAQRLGHDGDTPIRAFSAEAIRDEDLGFAGTAGRQVARWKRKGERALPAEVVGLLTKQMARLSRPDATEPHVAVFGDRAPLPAAIAGVGRVSLWFARLKDLLFAVSVEPYTRTTIKAAHANKRGILIVDALSRLARLAAEVPTHGRWFFYPLTSMLGAIVPGLAGEVSLAALQRTEARRAAFHVRRSQESRAVRCPRLS